MNASSHDKPVHFPEPQVNGAPLKPITQVLLDRRATTHLHGGLQQIRQVFKGPPSFDLQDNAKSRRAPAFEEAAKFFDIVRGLHERIAQKVSVSHDLRQVSHVL